jgi:hypothetical protein
VSTNSGEPQNKAGLGQRLLHRGEEQRGVLVRDLGQLVVAEPQRMLIPSLLNARLVFALDEVIWLRLT